MNLQSYIDKGLVKETLHPEYPNLAIYNYTALCQYSREWDDVTKACRGLVIDKDTGVIVAKPWPKFFNLSEHPTIPSGPAHVTEKMDGSLGIVFWYDGKWHISTRGSFASEQAVKAKEWISDVEFPEGYTHLFEIIYPDNRVVVDYADFEGLVYLESICMNSHKPFQLEFWEGRRAQYYGPCRPEDLPDSRDNEEGYVLYWPEHDFRAKSKFDEYVRLHKIMTEYSMKRLWEHLKEGGDIAAFVNNVPDEFYNEVSRDYEIIGDTYNRILRKAVEIKNEVVSYDTRKEQAKAIMSWDKDLSGIVFKMLDDKDATQQIWRKVQEWLNL